MKNKKLNRIRDEHPKANVKFVEKVYEKVIELENKNSKVTISRTAEELKEKREKVSRIFSKYLLHYELIERIGKGNRIPFFRLTNFKGESIDFIYGKINRDKLLEEDLKKLRKILKPKEFNSLLELKDKQSKLLIKRNEFVKSFWKAEKYQELNLIELNSLAGKYKSKN